jgi:hypothetical protein
MKNTKKIIFIIEKKQKIFLLRILEKKILLAFLMISIKENEKPKIIQSKPLSKVYYSTTIKKSTY